MTRLWELATYELKPRLNRMLGVSTIVVQGGQEPEFEVRPDPAKLLQTQTNIPAVLDAIGRSNMIDSPGLFESRHQLVLSLVSGQARTIDDISNIVVKMTATTNLPVRIGDIATVSPSVKPVYVTVTANAKPAVLLNVFRQPDSNTAAVADAVHRDGGQSRGDAIRSAIAEIRAPLVGSTITPIVVFLPLVSITGVTGTFFRALAVTVGMALLTSLALALTWTPTLSHYFIRDRETTGTPRRHDAVPPRLMRAYERTLRTALKRPLMLVVATLVVVAGAYVCYRALGSDLLPEMDEGGFILDYIMPAGSSLEETNRVLVGVEQILRSTPEVEGTSRRTGLQLGLAAVTETNTGDIAVKLKPKRDRASDQVIGELRGKIRAAYPMLDIEFVQLLQDMIGDLTSAP